MSEDLPIREGLAIPGWELWYSTSRASGAGGQHVNRTESRVTLHWVPSKCSVLTDAQKARLLRALAPRLTGTGELQLHCEEERSQHRNRELVRARLAQLVARAIVPRKRRRKTKPTRGSVERRLASKQRTSQKKRLRGKVGEDD